MELWETIITSLELKLLTSPATLRHNVKGAYCGDLLSDVLAHAAPGDLWITIHRHRNVVAVASLININGVIITGGRLPDADTLEVAEKEGIPVFTTPLNNFQASGRLYNILVNNCRINISINKKN